MGLMTGVVAWCDLVHGAVNANYVEYRRIGITPVGAEFDRLMSVLGNKFHRKTLHGPIDEGSIVNFSTRIKGAGSKYSSECISSSSLFLSALIIITGPQKASTPKRNPKMFAKRQTTTLWHAMPFPPFLDYEDNGGCSLLLFWVFCIDCLRPVPIYDARQMGFNFEQKDFDGVRALPLFKEKPAFASISDLPSQALVTVFYTANTYISKNQVKRDGQAPQTPGASGAQELFGESALVLSLNVQFVVLHGFVPEGDE